MMVAQRLLALGVETTVLLPDRGSGELLGQLAARGILHATSSLTRLGPSPGELGRYGWHFARDVRALARRLTAGRFDLVHASGGAWQIKGVLAARWAGIPSVWHLNDTCMPAPVRWSFRLLAPWAPSAFIVAGDRVRDYYLEGRRYPQAVFKIPAPVVTAEFQRGAAAADPAAPRGGLVCVGNLNPLKGYRTLLEAIELLDQRAVAVRCVVVGALFASQRGFVAEIRERASRLTASRLELVGAQSDVRPFLEAADVFVCPSLAEASPMAIWEAMSLGCPIVSTDVGDTAQYIRNGVSGYLVQTGDPRALADGIQRMLADLPAARRMGARASEIAQLEFDIDSVVRKHEDCYRAVAGRWRGRGYN
jgi:glycosyltransferase involved in cell wall biosynthesis